MNTLLSRCHSHQTADFQAVSKVIFSPRGWYNSHKVFFISPMTLLFARKLAWDYHQHNRMNHSTQLDIHNLCLTRCPRTTTSCGHGERGSWHSIIGSVIHMELSPYLNQIGCILFVIELLKSHYRFCFHHQLFGMSRIPGTHQTMQNACPTHLRWKIQSIKNHWWWEGGMNKK